MSDKRKIMLKEFHRFLDESGDTTFYGKGKRIIIGEYVVSKCFILGMVKFKTKLETIREQIIKMQNEIVADEFFKDVPSIKKKTNKTSYYFHAKDDIPEVREKFLRYIKALNCSFEAVVARKLPEVYVNKHKGNEAWFYADRDCSTKLSLKGPLSHLRSSAIHCKNYLIAPTTSSKAASRPRGFTTTVTPAADQ